MLRSTLTKSTHCMRASPSCMQNERYKYILQALDLGQHPRVWVARPLARDQLAAWTNYRARTGTNPRIEITCVNCGASTRQRPLVYHRNLSDGMLPP